MTIVTPQSEDFFYWAPEEICNYPIPSGPEDAWFIDRDDGEAGWDWIAPDKEAGHA